MYYHPLPHLIWSSELIWHMQTVHAWTRLCTRGSCHGLHYLFGMTELLMSIWACPDQGQLPLSFFNNNNFNQKHCHFCWKIEANVSCIFAENYKEFFSVKALQVFQQTILHGLPMLVDKTNFGLVLYNHSNFYWFQETSSYWPVKSISVFLCFPLVNQ